MRWLKFSALILAIFFALLGTASIYLLGAQNPASQEKTLVEITPGETRSEVAQQLAEKKLIRSAYAFFLYSRLMGGRLLPGTYELSPSMSASVIANMIATGSVKRRKITIIEGWRVSQIADYLAKEKLDKTGDFAAVAGPYEGYLFPDTYEVNVDITSEELVKLMRENFRKRTEGLTVLPETVILASIVEREAKNDVERAEIARVYLNRLKIGMKLEADPTVQYAKGGWSALTVEDYRSVDSPYNTYLNAGLPPGPICNPGLASIKAVLSPANHDYLFFFHAKGEIFFSKTLEEHRAKVRQNY